MALSAQGKIDPLKIVRRVAGFAPRVVVMFSCGKDSLAALDLATHFWPADRIHPCYMYFTPGLSFHEECIARTEARYGVTVTRLPHWALCYDLRVPELVGEAVAARNALLPTTKVTDVEGEMRRRVGADAWVLTGQKKCDSLERRGMLWAVDGCDFKARRAYPCADWSEKAVDAYLKLHDIRLPADYDMIGRSYGGNLYGPYLAAIKRRFPEDYARIRERFPGADAILFRHETFGTPGFKDHRLKGRKT